MTDPNPTPALDLDLVTASNQAMSAVGLTLCKARKLAHVAVTNPLESLEARLALAELISSCDALTVLEARLTEAAAHAEPLPANDPVPVTPATPDCGLCSGLTPNCPVCS